MSISTFCLKDFNQSLLALLECPVCLRYMSTSPIFLCENGHNICTVCKPKLERCPSCKAAFSGAKNFALQELAEKVFYPCENSDAGCEEEILLSNVEKHRQTCPYRLYQCLMCADADSNWKGRRSEILAHCEKEHADRTWMRGSDITLHFKDFDINKDGSYCQILFAHDEIFWYMNRCMASDKTFYISVHYIGPVENCTQYSYEIEYVSADKMYKSAFKSPTHADFEDINTIIEQKQCSSLHGNIAKNFLLPNGILECKLRISKHSSLPI